MIFQRGGSINCRRPPPWPNAWSVFWAAPQPSLNARQRTGSANPRFYFLEGVAASSPPEWPKALVFPVPEPTTPIPQTPSNLPKEGRRRGKATVNIWNGGRDFAVLAVENQAKFAAERAAFRVPPEPKTDKFLARTVRLHRWIRLVSLLRNVVPPI
jgi:hypothetical protein